MRGRSFKYFRSTLFQLCPRCQAPPQPAPRYKFPLNCLVHRMLRFLFIQTVHAASPAAPPMRAQPSKHRHPLQILGTNQGLARLHRSNRKQKSWRRRGLATGRSFGLDQRRLVSMSCFFHFAAALIMRNYHRARMSASAGEMRRDGCNSYLLVIRERRACNKRLKWADAA